MDASTHRQRAPSGGSRPGWLTWFTPGRFGRRRLVAGFGTAVLGPLAVTLVGSAAALVDKLGMLLPLYLLVVVVVALVGSLLPALVAIAVSGLCANWFFSPPTGALSIADPETWLQVVIFIAVAVVVAVLVQSNIHRGRVADSLRSSAEDAERLAFDNRARGALLSAVSHDLRTPLAGIKSGISSLRATDITWSKDDEAQLLAGVEDSADRLEALIDNLLDMSRLQTGSVAVWPASVSLDIVLARAAAGLSEPGRVSVDPDINAIVRVDTGLMERVIANLMENAVRYQPVHAGPVRVAVRAGEKVAVVRVIDHGPGVPLSDRDRIFLPFQRREDHSSGEGVGLGLAVARGLAEAMHATVGAEETPGGGLTMVVTIPLAEEDL